MGGHGLAEIVEGHDVATDLTGQPFRRCVGAVDAGDEGSAMGEAAGRQARHLAGADHQATRPRDRDAGGVERVERRREHGASGAADGGFGVHPLADPQCSLEHRVEGMDPDVWDCWASDNASRA